MTLPRMMKVGGNDMANKKKQPAVNKRQSAKETFPHFRYYFKSRHPALILKEEDSEKYRFRRITTSELSGHHKNEKVDPNPDRTRSTPMYIVKAEQTDKKKRFSPWKYPWVYSKKK